MNCQPKDVVRNEPRGVRRFEHKRLREPMCWVLVRLRVQIEKKVILNDNESIE